MLKCAVLIVLSGVVVWASQPWKSTDPRQWTTQDVERVLNDSPWAQSAGASFGLADADRQPLPPGPLPGAAEAGLAGPRGATDGRWDGGVGRPDRNRLPRLNVTVRWDSALPVRQALERSQTGPVHTPDQTRKNYVVTVIGLVPAGRYGRPELKTRSGDTRMDPRNPEEMLEGVMRNSRLLPRGKAPIRPDDAKLDEATGALQLFFPRSEVITDSTKEVTFETRFGSLSVVKKFRLKDMVYRGQLEL